MLRINIYHGPPQRRASRGTGAGRISASWFKPRLIRAARLLGIRRGEWSIWLVNDRHMARLHKRTMEKPTTTDVLTFDFRDAPADPLELQTLVCVDAARRQNDGEKNGLYAELLLYMVHSLLHVSGYDDNSGRSAQKMHAREDDILTRLGVGPVYASKHAAAPKTPRFGAKSR